MSFRAFVLAKNEERNIERCLSALHAGGASVTVLDSGSEDKTREIAEALGAGVEPYRYANHLTAYRYVCRERIPRGEVGLVLDADMVVTPSLFAELRAGASRPEVDVILAPVEMWWSGAPLLRGSLYPPKPIAFRGGQEYFEPSGHGERLRPDVRIAHAHALLIHDDRKPLLAYLATQVRYAQELVQRAQHEDTGLLDQLRFSTPFLIPAVPAFSYLVRGGITAGRVGLVYALDRLIAEAIMFREAVASRIKTRSRDAGSCR